MSKRLHMNTVDSHLSPLSVVYLQDTYHPKGVVSYLFRDSCSSSARGPPTVYMIHDFLPLGPCLPFSAQIELRASYSKPRLWKSNRYCRHRELGTTLDHSENMLSTTGQKRIRSYRTSKLVPRDAHLQRLKPTRSSNSSQKSEYRGGEERGDLQSAYYTGI